MYGFRLPTTKFTTSRRSCPLSIGMGTAGCAYAPRTEGLRATAARICNCTVPGVGTPAAAAALAEEQGNAAVDFQVAVWPQDLVEFLQRRLAALFMVRAYVLDPAGCVDPEHGVAKPQALNGSEPIDGDPFRGLIRIDEISAQRGFGVAGEDNGDRPPSPSADPGSCQLSSASTTPAISILMRIRMRKTSLHLRRSRKPRKPST